MSGPAIVADCSERELIARIRRQLLPAPGWLLVGIGDDAAVVEPERNRVEVLTVDALVEGIADSFKGVSKSFALQAGREIRIMVESEKISDEEAVWLSKDIARRIENELEYPGQIKVTVIRETRAVDYAR